jgi:hypothetical protein
VLMKSINCGIFGVGSGAKGVSKWNTSKGQKMNVAANYAQQCYATNRSTIFDCNRFVVGHLPTEVDDHAPCPFDRSICQTQDSNIRLDTGRIDMNDQLGLNLPPNQRALYRYVLHCAPLATEGFKDTVLEKDTNETFIRYYYGKSTTYDSNDKFVEMNYTLKVPSLSEQYGRFNGIRDYSLR